MFHFICESNNAAINRMKKLLKDFFSEGQRGAGDYPTYRYLGSALKVSWHVPLLIEYLMLIHFNLN